MALSKNQGILSSIDEYMSYIYGKCEKSMELTKPNKIHNKNHNKVHIKIVGDDIIMPTIESYDLLLTTNYNGQQLKNISTTLPSTTLLVSK